MLQQFIAEYFTEDATFVTHLHDKTVPNDNVKGRFEIPQPSLARYFLVQFESGVEEITVKTPGAEQSEAGDGTRHLHCSQAKFIYSYNNGVQVCLLVFSILQWSANGARP